MKHIYHQLQSKLISGIKRVAVWVFASMLLAAFQPVSAIEISIPDFSQAAGSLLLNGNAQIHDKVLRLTEDAEGQAGSAFLKQGFLVNKTTDFQANFQFRITPGSDPDGSADGLAFVIQGSGSQFLGDAGGSIGYMGDVGNITRPVFAVEFDTHSNGNLNDSSGNHVAITKISGSNRDAVHLDSRDIPINFDNGIIKNVKIEYGYHNQPGRLNVFLSEGYNVIPQLILSYDFPDEDLFQFGGASTYFGFTAATGDGTSIHDIVSWGSTASGPGISIPEPATLALFGAGLAALGRRRKYRREDVK